MVGFQCLETIRNPNELNRLLVTIKELDGQRGRVASDRLQLAMKSRVFQIGFVPFNDLLDLALHFNLIQVHEDSVSITRTGSTFLTHNANYQYPLTEAQKHLLITSILFGRTPLSNEFEKILGEFSYNPKSHRYEDISRAQSGRLSARGIRLLCSALHFTDWTEDGICFLDPMYNTHIARRIRIFRHAEWGQGEPSEATIARSKEAEELIFNEEQRRLIDEGFPELSRRVQLVSDYNSAAGYDIQSYEGMCSRPEIPDRFIEVKSSFKEKIDFILTRNELETAREFRNRYRIVFVGKHDIGKQLADCRVVTIIDPDEHIFNRNEFSLDAAKLRVTEKGYKISED